MRQVSEIITDRPRRIRSRAADLVARLLPVWAYRKMMEYKFINFGVETTNICNANCTFCGYRFMKRAKTVMKWDLYEDAILKFVSAGGGPLNFTPTVGDPLVDKLLLEKIEFASKYTLITGTFLYTNGILLHRFSTDRLLKSGLRRLAISTFIGSSEGYNLYYGRNKYSQVLRNILTVSKRNRELGYPVHITLHLRVSGDKESWQKTTAYGEIAANIGEDNIDYLETYDAWSGLIDEADIPVGTKLEKSMPLEEKMGAPCFELYRRVHVLADGKVGACVCVDLEGEIEIGNIATQSLRDIWKGQALSAYRRKWVSGDMPKVCETCTRYQGVNQFIRQNRKRVGIDFMRATFPALLDVLTRGSAVDKSD